MGPLGSAPPGPISAWGKYTAANVSQLRHKGRSKLQNLMRPTNARKLQISRVIKVFLRGAEGDEFRALCSH